ncbi:sulfurtransferase complex subunit TusC [Paraglaciecola sp. 25GB23A]|uniref:sulfurtransferase complex subunit TusC n=1 Tax=Paraglaciecola sp. 25GB23A TaxID=3156068 RepID=UPI0032AF3939
MNTIMQTDHQELNTHLGVINRQGPYMGSNAQESLDLVMAMSNFGQQVSVFFLDDGVFQLLNNQSASAIERKQFTKGFAALEFYDVENIYVCATSLEERGLSASDLIIGAIVVGKDELSDLLQAHKQVINF